MKIIHSSVKSPIFELKKSLVVDLEVADYAFELRIELFQDTERTQHYRCRLWELDSFRLKDTKPMVKSGRPKDVSDDVLPSGRASRLQGDYGNFKAANEKAAIKIVLSDLMERLESWTGDKASLIYK